MLPSTGYFHSFNCPFYDNGLCDRPYCHFRHVRKILQNTVNDGVESGAISFISVSALGQTTLQTGESSARVSQQLSTESSSDKLGSQASPRVTYNPTPISELNKINNTDAENIEEINGQPKRHIPVIHTPSKPSSLPIIRPCDTNGATKLIYIPPSPEYQPGSLESVYKPGSVDNVTIDKYTPTATSHDSSVKRNYVPSSEKNHNKNKILEYEPSKLSSAGDKPVVTYRPTPRSLAPCFSSDEDEPDPKKSKLSPDLNILDDLETELDMVGEIIDDEKNPEDDVIVKKGHDIVNESDSKKNIMNHRKENVDVSKTDKSKDEIHSESKVERKDKEKKSKVHSKHKSENKHSEKKSSHKSSSRDRDKEKKRKDGKEKHSSDKKKHSSKSSDSSKSSRNSSSKKSEKHSSSKSKEKSLKEKHHKSSTKDKRKKKTSKQYPEPVEGDVFNVDENGHDDDTNMSDTDEETIAAECKKIFEEYEPTKPIIREETTKVEEIAEEEYIPGKKRISRTTDKNIKTIPRTPIKPDFKVSAAQTMAERLTKVREFHNSRQPPVPTPTQIDSSKTNAGSKIRIAYVPYASTLLKAKKTMPTTQTETKGQPSTSFTISQTIAKGQQRVAHIPSEKFIDRPGVLEPLASKIPANIRSLYLNKMIDECLKLYITSTDAYARAQHEELNTSKKCSTVQIYKNSATVTVGRLRRELQESNGVKKSGSDCSVLGKSASSNTNNTGSWSIEKKKVVNNSQEFIGGKLYKNIAKWILTEEQLKENGFPRPHKSGEKGRAIIYGQNKQRPPKGFIRTCCRCKKDYTVNKEGFTVINEECIYHPNNKYRVRGEARYQCCSQDATADGCCVAPSHVYEYVDFENLKGYIRTLPPEKEMDDYGVYSLDCEMCYTTCGLDLTRVTVIDSSCKIIYETLVRPSKPIIDYNTRYSGITEEQMASVKTTLIEVQATLLAMFNSKTILVGHSLESDFKALKLIHDTVIDTSVLFPHKMGPPFKRALRNLSSEHLKKIIQNSVDGHDSAEDAMVCMELLHYKLKEDLKSR